MKKSEFLTRPSAVVPFLSAILAVGGLLLVARPAHAQDAAAGEKASLNAQAQSDLAIVRAAINAERVDILNNYLGLTDAEAAGFWPLYKKYRTEMSAVNDDKAKMVVNFLQNGNAMSDDDARKLTESYLNANKKKVDIQRGYVGKFAKVLPGRKVARLYQLENKVDAYLAYQASDAMPLMPVK